MFVLFGLVYARNYETTRIILVHYIRNVFLTCYCCDGFVVCIHVTILVSSGKVLYNISMAFTHGTLRQGYVRKTIHHG